MSTRSSKTGQEGAEPKTPITGYHHLDSHVSFSFSFLSLSLSLLSSNLRAAATPLVETKPSRARSAKVIERAILKKTEGDSVDWKDVLFHFFGERRKEKSG